MGILVSIYLYVRKVLAKVNLGFFFLMFPRDFEQDGLATSRIRPFQDDDDFLIAKSRTIETLGKDFNIDWRSHTFIWALASTSKLPGAALELGTGRAWMFTLALFHPRIRDLRETFLIDRFLEQEVDKSTGQPIEGTTNPFYTSDVDGLVARFDSQAGVKLVKGDLPDVLDTLPITKVRFLHVDLNAAEPEVASVRKLWPMIVPGGIVLLDDFGSPEFIASNHAMKKLAIELGFEILGLPTGQGLIIKQ